MIGRRHDRRLNANGCISILGIFTEYFMKKSWYNLPKYTIVILLKQSDCI